MPSRHRQVPFGWIAFALYIISLMIPAIIAIQKPLLWGSPHDEVMVGFQCLVLGWLTSPWYANLALWIAAIALASRRLGVAAVFSGIAIVLALTLFAYLDLPDTYVRAPQVGYFVWLASMVVVFVGSSVRLHVERRDRFALWHAWEDQAPGPG